MKEQEKSDKFDIYVVGAGAIGRVVASLLSFSGHAPILVCRDKTARIMRLQKEFNFFSAQKELGPCQPDILGFKDIESHELSGRPQIFFHATKASYLSKTVKEIKALIGLNATHVFLQGGIPWWMGHTLPDGNFAELTDPESSIKQAVGSLENVHAGMVKFGASTEHKNSGTTVYHKAGDFTLTPVFASQKGFNTSREIVDLFDPDLLQPEISQAPAKQAIWAKAAGSFAMSSMALIHNATLGEMTSSPEMLDDMINIAHCILDIGKEVGIHISHPIDYEAYFKSIADKKPEHMMSITKDQSEIEQLLLWPIEIGRRAGCNIAALESAVKRIKPDIHCMDSFSKHNPSAQLV